MQLEGARVMITGATGFLGRHLAARLRMAGTTVIGCARAPGPGGIPMDITDPFSVAAVLGPDNPVDVVVHAAALVGDQGAAHAYQSVNVEGTRHLVRAAQEAGVQRFIHISSISVLGFAPGPRADEDSELLETGDPYADSKVGAELEVLAAHQRGDLPVTIVRPGDLWGAGSRQWVERPLELMRARRFLWVDGGGGHLFPVHIRDVVEGIVGTLCHPDAVGRTYILTDQSKGTTCKTYFSRLAAAAGTSSSALSLPRPLALMLAAGVASAARGLGQPPPFTPSAIRYLSRPPCEISCGRARTEIGYDPKITLEAGMKKLTQHLRTATRA